jgi:hypothetical protein
MAHGGICKIKISQTLDFRHSDDDDDDDVTDPIEA